MLEQELFFSVGSIILDDIVLPDGETRMAILGGGATHAAMGMRAWTDAVGIVAPIGENFPPDRLEQLGQYFDLSGLQRRSAQTPRAWQVYEADGRRREVFRTSLDEFLAGAPWPQELPLAYQGATGVHLQCVCVWGGETLEPLQSWITQLRGGKEVRFILWEPWDIFCIPENRPALQALLPQVDVFSPNLLEAQRLTGLVEPQAIARALLDDGARCVALRMGGHGSLVVEEYGGAGWRIHPVPALAVRQIVDVTGAGNAYCGGFLVGLARTGSLLQAGQYGAVSASLALEQYGALIPLTELRQRAESRLATLRSDSQKPYSPANPRRAVFDRMAPGWDQRPAPPDAPEKLSRVTAAGTIPLNGNVLDLGAGTGVLTQALLDYQPGRLVEIDLSLAMLGILQDRFATQAHLWTAVADGSWLPFLAEIFDVVFCHAVFPHFPDRSQALQELLRVLKPGGRLVISHAAGHQQVNAIHQNAPDKVLHQDLLPPAAELARLLSTSGWQVVENVDEADFYLVVAARL